MATHGEIRREDYIHDGHRLLARIDFDEWPGVARIFRSLQRAG